jgi:GNAT superfamily N-acetyltransferase
MNLQNFSIRQATVEDVPLILQFILELAEYEGLAHEVDATEDLLRENLFGSKPSAEVVFGCHEGTPVGFALFFQNFSTFQAKPGIYLEDLYVRPGLRGKGYGTAMLAFLAKLAVKRNGGRFEWGVLTWNTPAREYYVSIGAKPQERFLLNRMEGAALETLAARFPEDAWPFEQPR